MSNEPKDGGPAFPVLYGQTNGLDGMSLRDWFAGQYLAGTRWSSGTLEVHVEDAFRAADVALDVRLRALSA